MDLSYSKPPVNEDQKLIIAATVVAARIIGRPCTHLPLAVSVPSFAPATLDQPRTIDVQHRPAPVAHQALLEEAERLPSFYYHYETVAASGARPEPPARFVDLDLPVRYA